jgi:hypothetical protein
VSDARTDRKPGEYAEALRILTVDLRLQVYAERQRRGLSLQAAALELGVFRTELGRFETAGVMNPTVATLRRYVDWLTFSSGMPA